jgi:hypothetical protein
VMVYVMDELMDDVMDYYYVMDDSMD